MKQLFLIVFSLQFSLCCFSQSDSKHHYTDQEVTKLAGYIISLEKIISAVTPPPINSDDKKQVAALLIDPSHNYSDEDVIKIFKYIKELEQAESLNNLAIITSSTKKNDTTLETVQMKYLLVKGSVIFEDSLSNRSYSNISITVADKKNNEIVGVYAPNSKTGKYIFILSSGLNYLITSETKGYQAFSGDFYPEYKTESYETTYEIKFKKE